MSSEPERLISSGVAARELGVTGTTLRRWMDSGRIRPASRTMGGHARWNLAELRQQIEQLALTEDEPEPEPEPEQAPTPPPIARFRAPGFRQE
jgi:hypothetical protein